MTVVQRLFRNLLVVTSGLDCMAGLLMVSPKMCQLHADPWNSSLNSNLTQYCDGEWSVCADRQVLWV